MFRRPSRETRRMSESQVLRFCWWMCIDELLSIPSNAEKTAKLGD
jgi:hypothetical protein